MRSLDIIVHEQDSQKVQGAVRDIIQNYLSHTHVKYSYIHY